MDAHFSFSAILFFVKQCVMYGLLRYSINSPEFSQNKYILFFTSIFVLFVVFYTLSRVLFSGRTLKSLKSSKSQKTQKSSPSHPPTLTPLQKVPNFLWMYWETPPNKSKPSYIDMCIETVYKNCSKNFEIHILDQNSVRTFLPDLRPDLNSLRIPQKADYIRLALLKKYGGVWMDADIIVLKDFFQYMNLLKHEDFVGFGCHHPSCLKNPVGYPRPANWTLISRPNGRLISNCLDKANQILNTYSNAEMHQSKNYHILGRNLLWGEIDALLATQTWDYHHVSSQCLDRDSKNEKWTNKRAISREPFDISCLRRLSFVPVYNTAPGFPPWFHQMSRAEILKDNMLISQMFRIGLGIQHRT